MKCELSSSSYIRIPNSIFIHIFLIVCFFFCVGGGVKQMFVSLSLYLKGSSLDPLGPTFQVPLSHQPTSMLYCEKPGIYTHYLWQFKATKNGWHARWTVHMACSTTCIARIDFKALGMKKKQSNGMLHLTTWQPSSSRINYEFSPFRNSASMSKGIKGLATRIWVSISHNRAIWVSINHHRAQYSMHFI